MARPLPQFNGFVGQSQAVLILKRQIEGGKKLAQPLSNTIFLGPSGVGKTHLARAVAKELGTTLVIVSGYATLEEVVGKVRELNVGDVLFIDEAHNLAPKVQEAMYAVIDSRRLPEWAAKGVPVPDGSGDDPLAVKPATLILATDRPGELLNAMRKRIALSIELQYYTPRELKDIVDVLATEKQILLSSQASHRIAKISQGLPRCARHHLEKLQMHFPEAVSQQIGLPELQEYQSDFGISENGLTRLQTEYLIALGHQGTASIETIAATLGQDVYWVRQELESYLLRLHFVKIGPRGRELTSTGQTWLKNANIPVERTDDHEHDGGGQTAD